MKNPVLERLQAYDIRPRKALGQHFLIDPAHLRRLVEHIDPGPGRTILEYGAGVGVLTEALLEAGAHVVAVELDDDLARLLETELGPRPGFRLVHADLAKVSPVEILRETGASSLKLAGNLPYQLTSHVLFGLLDLEDRLADAVFMVQREVAERIVAPAGTRDYGILSVLLRSYYDVTLVMRVRPGAFFPAPRVESAVLHLVPRKSVEGPTWDEREDLTALVKSVFQERRKTLRNTLKKFYPLDSSALLACEESSGLDLGRRPETLETAEFAALLRVLPSRRTAPQGE